MSSNKTINSSDISIKSIIELPISKSISNRQLMIYSYANWNTDELNISNADDSVLLKSILNEIRENEEDNSLQISKEIYCKNAGTVARFILPFLCIQNKEYILTGSDRMRTRPIQALVNSLQEIGASIELNSDTEAMPLKIASSDIKAKEIDIDISKSSQFASAILMMLPSIADESVINLKGELLSLPYIILTLELMKEYGVNYNIDGRKIRLKGLYTKPTKEYSPERDWSSASYFYELLAIRAEGEILLKDLKLDSLQGDRRLAEIFNGLGISSEQKPAGVLINYNGEINYNQNIDFEDVPDLAPAVICTCAALGIIGKFTGLQSLNHKESRRMDVLCSELDKLGYDLRDNGMDEYILINSCKPQMRNADFSNITINTHSDHRMAMAFAPFALIGSSINISDPQSVEKSFPLFWKELF